MFCPQNQIVGFTPVKEIEFASGAENDPYGFKPTDLVVDRDGSLLIADWADGQRPSAAAPGFIECSLWDRNTFPRVPSQGRLKTCLTTSPVGSSN